MKNTSRDHAEVFIESDEMPPRSQLYSIPPYGIGTWQVESLPSYIRRLSAAHAIPMCKLKQLALGPDPRKPECPDTEPTNSQVFWGGVGGNGRLTRRWIDGLNPLLKLNRTADTTLLFLADRVAMRNLLSATNRYCPKCEQIIRGHGKNYQLLMWCIQAVKMCPVHSCPLEEERASVHYLRARWRMVKPKGKPAQQNTEQVDLMVATRKDSELQRAILVMAMLESPAIRNGLPTNPKCNVAGFLNHVIEQSMGGVAIRLANFLGVSKGCLHGWTSEAHLPTFGQVIDIAQAFNCPIESVLAGDASQLPLILSGFTRQSPRAIHILHNVKGRNFRLALIKLINKEEYLHSPPSLAEVARRLGVDRTQLASAYPDIANEVTKKFQKWRSDNKILFQSIRQYAYREAAITIARAGRVPTRNRVMYLLENVSVFSVKDRRACQRICEDVRREFRIHSRR